MSCSYLLERLNSIDKNCFQHIHTVGDGNCFWYSLFYQLYNGER